MKASQTRTWGSPDYAPGCGLSFLTFVRLLLMLTEATLVQMPPRSVDSVIQAL